MLNFRSVSLFALAVAVAAPAAAQQQVQSPFAVPGQQAQIRDPLTPQAVPVGASPAPTTGRAVNPAVAHPLNLEQKAWERPDANKGARQIRPGFLHLAWRPDDVPQINVREGLLTTIKFPEQEEIVSNIVSDPGSYETLVAPNRHSIALRALYAGVDGNIVIYGKSGNVYNFYIRSRPFNDPKLPDTTVRISVGGMTTATGETMASDTPESPAYEGYKGLMTPSATLASANFKAGKQEYARTTPPKGVNMANNIEIKVRNATDQAIAPIRAWHDDHFTWHLHPRRNQAPDRTRLPTGLDLFGPVAPQRQRINPLLRWRAAELARRPTKNALRHDRGWTQGAGRHRRMADPGRHAWPRSRRHHRRKPHA